MLLLPIILASSHIDNEDGQAYIIV
jgi:hypothetical protein